MPAIYLFHRKTIFGGDDLQPAAVLTASLRFVQLTLLLGPVAIHISKQSRQFGGIFRYMLYDPSDDASCRHSNLYATLLVAYTIASAVYSVASVILEWRIAYWSSTGSPTQSEPRSTKVSALLELKLIPFSIILFLVWMLGISALSFVPLYNYCYDLSQENDQQQYLQQEEPLMTSVWNAFQVWWITIMLLLLGQIAEVLFYFVFLIHLCRQPVHQDYQAEGQEMNLTFTHELIEEMWADRCAAACQCLSVASCFMFGGRELLGQVEFGDVARALADYLETRGTLDVVPSDIVTGLVLLQRLQGQRLRRARLEVVSQNSSTLSEMERGGRGIAPSQMQSSGSSSSDQNIPQPESLPPTQFTPLGNVPQQSMYALGSDGELHRKTRAILNPASQDDLLVLEEGARYAKYALAIYTWVLYLYVHPLSGPPRLCLKGCKRCCCSLINSNSHSEAYSPNLRRRLLVQNGRVDRDNICETHKVALLITAGLTDADLVYAQLRNGFADTPYAILLDHEWRSVVIAIRGTFSLEDCVTDVLIEPESLESFGAEYGFDATNQYCHGGVLACVKNMYRDLQSHGLLDELLSGNQSRYPSYTLRIVGHSLGASIGTVLSYVLRQKYPSLRCINYSPPGHTLTWDLARACRDWCSTFVLDSDLVPRLSLSAMERLRNEVLSLVGRIRVSKLEVATELVRGSGLSGCHCFEFDEEIDNDVSYDIGSLLYDESSVPDSHYQRQLSRFLQVQEERRESRGHTREVDLYPPGRMVHVVKTGEQRTCAHNIAKCLTCGASNAGSSYTPVWIENDDLAEIVVSPTMGTDHFPNRIRAMLEAVAADYGIRC